MTSTFQTIYVHNILYIKATVVFVCLSVVTNRARQGDQGRHPPVVFSYRHGNARAGHGRDGFKGRPEKKKFRPWMTG
jgi:hypothetical protein